MFEQKAAILQGSLRHPTQGQHQSAGLNVNSQCASCVLVCKFVCVQSYPRGPPQKPPQGSCWLCVTFQLVSTHLAGNPGTELQLSIGSQVLLQGYLESGGQWHQSRAREGAEAYLPATSVTLILDGT